MNRELRSGDLYRHFKNKLYQIVTVATHSETGEKLVIYQALYGDYKVYARPLEMFLSEVDHEKYPEVKQKYRFEKVEIGTLESQEETVESNAAASIAQPTAGTAVVGQQTEAQSRLGALGRASEVPSTGTDRAGATHKPDASDSEVSSKLLAFFDADELQTKYNILVSMRDELNDTLIDNMAVSLDIVIPDGEIMDRFDELKRCIRTKQQYELTRRTI